MLFFSQNPLIRVVSVILATVVSLVLFLFFLYIFGFILLAGIIGLGLYALYRKFIQKNSSHTIHTEYNVYRDEEVPKSEEDYPLTIDHDDGNNE